MLRTNSKKYLENMHNFVCSAIDCPATKPADKIKFLFECYESEFKHEYNKRRHPNAQERFANWLAGLPSAISLPCYYSEILDLAKWLQEVDEYPKRTESQILNNFYNFMAYHILKIKSRYNV